MAQAIIRFAMFAVLVCLLKGLAFAGLTIPQIVKKSSPSVVTIVALDENDQPLALASGFFVNKKGYLATNYHVFEGSVKAIIKTIRGTEGHIIEIVKADPALDLVVAKTSIEQAEPMQLGDSDSITVGEEVVAIGNPVGLEGTVSKGIISGIRVIDGKKLIQITAPISPGSSGGPIVNLSGSVIGVATAYISSGQNLNFAMPINYLRDLKTTRLSLQSLQKIPEKAKNAHQLPIAPHRAETAPPDFRGVQWGIRYETINDLMPVPKHKQHKNYGPHVGVYTRQRDKLKIGEANLGKIHYYFYKHKFCRVKIYFDSKSNLEKIKGTLFYAYGKVANRHKDDVKQKGQTFNFKTYKHRELFKWKFDSVDIILHYAEPKVYIPITNYYTGEPEYFYRGELILEYKPVWIIQREKDRIGEIKKGVNDL